MANEEIMKELKALREDVQFIRERVMKEYVPTENELEEVDEQMKEVRKGNTVSSEQLRRELQD